MTATQDFADSNALRFTFLSSAAFFGPLKGMKNQVVRSLFCISKAPSVTQFVLNSVRDLGFHQPIDFDIVFSTTGKPDPNFANAVDWSINQTVNRTFAVGSETVKIIDVTGSVPGELFDVNSFDSPCGKSALQVGGESSVGIIKDGPYLTLQVTATVNGLEVVDECGLFAAFYFGKATPTVEQPFVSYEISRLLELMRHWFNPGPGPESKVSVDLSLAGAIHALSHFLPEHSRRNVQEAVSSATLDALRRRSVKS